MQVNGTAVKKGAICVLNSGDEVVFGAVGNHAYVSSTLFNLMVQSFLFVDSSSHLPSFPFHCFVCNRVENRCYCFIVT